MLAPCAHHEAPLGHPSVCVDSALGALEARWPAQRRQIGVAGCVRREPSLEVGQCLRVVLHAEERYRLWPLESSGYPTKSYLTASWAVLTLLTKENGGPMWTAARQTSRALAANITLTAL